MSVIYGSPVMLSSGMNPQIIVTAPTGSTVTAALGGKTYTAQEQSGKWTINVRGYGTYTVTATLGGQKATTTVVVNTVKQYPVTLAYFSATLRVTSESGATVTARGPQTVSGTVPSNGVLDLKITLPGTYSVSASKSGETTYSVSVQITNSGQIYETACLFLNKDLLYNTWEQINQASKAGVASSIWKVGDEKSLRINFPDGSGYSPLTFVIVGFNHDDLTGGGKAGITFGVKHVEKSPHVMNSTATTEGGFTGTDAYSWMQNILFKQLSPEVQSVIKTVNKKTSAGNGSHTINTNAMKLFLFSESEVFGANKYSVAGEGTQYPYFATASNRIKKTANGTGYNIKWWERSPRAEGNSQFCAVDLNGDATVIRANSYDAYICFGFCV